MDSGVREDGEWEKLEVKGWWRELKSLKERGEEMLHGGEESKLGR